MPTKREREYYRMGFLDGRNEEVGASNVRANRRERDTFDSSGLTFKAGKGNRRRKLSAWNKFVKANSKKPRFIYKSGSNKGKVNLKKMGVAFRKTPAGKKKK